jgi:IPT/TIG domain
MFVTHRLPRILSLLALVSSVTVAACSSAPSTEPPTERMPSAPLTVTALHSSSALREAANASRSKRLFAPQLPSEQSVRRAAHAQTRAPSRPVAEDLVSATPPNVSYGGGPILQRPEVYAVYWGTGVPEATRERLEEFYGAITGDRSPYIAALAEYDTVSPRQSIGRATFRGAVVDEDAPLASVVTDVQIQAELSRLIDTGKLPANDGRNVYMVHFPPNITIDLDGLLSCEVFCAYHSPFARNGANAYYAVMPDPSTGDCASAFSRCHLGATPFDDTTYSASHELVETITDPDSGPGWVGDNGEIADSCEVGGQSLRGFTVTTYWSNVERGCHAHANATTMVLDVAPAEITVPVGGSASFTITASGRLTTPMALSLEFLDPSVSATFTPPTIAPGRPVTLTLATAAAQPAGSTFFRVEGTDANGTFHYQDLFATLQGAQPTITSLSQTSGPSQGGNTITITGTHLSASAQAFFDGVTASLSFGGGGDGTSLTIPMPAHAVGFADLVVVNPDGRSATLPHAYEYTLGAAPTATSLQPTQGPIAGGDFVNITGSAGIAFDANFNYSSPKVTFGGVPATVYNVNRRIMQLITPPGAAVGPVDVVVTNADGQSVTLASGYTYQSGGGGGGTPSPPEADSVATAGDAASARRPYVTIFGAGFDAAARVTFDGKPGLVKTNDPAFLGVVAPAHKPGNVAVVVTNGDGQSASVPGGFTYE